MSPGRHLIRVVKEGYEAYEILENIGGDRKKVTVHLRKVVTEGELLIRTEPNGALIYVEGKSVGMDSYERKGLSRGTYRIRVVKEGCEAWEGEEPPGFQEYLQLPPGNWKKMEVFDGVE